MRLRGHPETIELGKLRDTVTTIFHRVLASVAPELIELDRVHRVSGPRPTDTNRPQDIICRLLRYTHKEDIVREAWTMGTIDFEGVNIKILPDLSRATLQRRALLRPLLDPVRQLDHTYRWIFPFALTIRKGSSAFTLHRPADLLELFTFLEIPPMVIPEWLQPLQSRFQ